VVLGMRLPYIESSVSKKLQTAVGNYYNDENKVNSLAILSVFSDNVKR